MVLAMSLTKHRENIALNHDSSRQSWSGSLTPVYKGKWTTIIPLLRVVVVVVDREAQTIMVGGLWSVLGAQPAPDEPFEFLGYTRDRWSPR